MRTIVACTKCSAQYDISECMDQMMHCSCGELLSKITPELHDGRVVKCSNCGGTVKEGALACEYCSATLSLSDKGWGSMCPKCFVRLPDDAKFCVTCGTGIHAQKLTGKESKLTCPRCDCLLTIRNMDSLNVAECGTCGGIWTPIESFEAMVSEKNDVSFVARGLLGASSRRRIRFEISTTEKVKYICCPQCMETMNRRNFGQNSGIIIDTCREHGVWLDNQELSQIVKFLEDGGSDQNVMHQANQRTAAPYTTLTEEDVQRLRRSQPAFGLRDVLGAVLRFLK